jgi:hypothetical protein
MNMTPLEKAIAWLFASIIAVGAWMLMTSAASGANNFPVPVLADSRHALDSANERNRVANGGEARESNTRRTVPDAGKERTLAAGNTLRSVVSSVPSLTGTSLATTSRLACYSVPADSFLDAIERIESNGNAHAIGDKGKARGPFQFWAVAWHDVSRVRSKRGQSVAPYWGATNRVTARSYAMTYLGMLHHQLTRALRRTPTHAEQYAAFNMGFSAFRRTGFSLSRCPASTQKAAARINSMLANSQGGAASKGQMRIGASMAGMARR